MIAKATALAALDDCIGARWRPDFVFVEVLTLMKLGADVVEALRRREL